MNLSDAQHTILRLVANSRGGYGFSPGHLNFGPVRRLIVKRAICKSDRQNPKGVRFGLIYYSLTPEGRAHLEKNP